MAVLTIFFSPFEVFSFTNFYLKRIQPEVGREKHEIRSSSTLFYKLKRDMEWTTFEQDFYTIEQVQSIQSLLLWESASRRKKKQFTLLKKKA